MDPRRFRPPPTVRTGQVNAEVSPNFTSRAVSTTLLRIAGFSFPATKTVFVRSNSENFDPQFDPEITFVDQVWNEIDTRTKVLGTLNGLPVWPDVPEFDFAAATESSRSFHDSHQRRFGENANQSFFAEGLNRAIETWQSLEQLRLREIQTEAAEIFLIQFRSLIWSRTCCTGATGTGYGTGGCRGVAS